MPRRMDIAGTVPLLCRGSERELADSQSIATYVCKAAVHHSVIIWEYAHGCGLPHKPFHIGGGISLRHTHKHKQASPNGAVKPALYFNRCAAHTLYYESH